MNRSFGLRKANRLQGYDYSQEGYYFVTICVQNRGCYFGDVENKKMVLNKYGEIAEQQWLWLEKQYPYITLDTFVVMPDHMHGILVYDRRNYSQMEDPVGTGRDLSLQGSIKIKPLSEIIGAFKTTSSKRIHLNGFSPFSWQRSFHDHIIRNENALFRIRQYIDDNPKNWENDRNNPADIDPSLFL